MKNFNFFVVKILWGWILILLFRSIVVAQPYFYIPCDHLPRPMVINPAIRWTKSVDTPEYQGMPYQISFDRISDETPTYIWSSYKYGGENLYTTDYNNGRRSRTRLLSAGKGVYYKPIFISTGHNSGWAIWQQKKENNWEIVGRQFNKGIWEPIALISAKGKQSLFPAVTVFDKGIAVAWEDHSINPQRLVVRIWNGSEWSLVESHSQMDKPSFRPELIATPTGELWMAWDSYEGLNYSVYSRLLKPTLGEIEMVSEPEISNRSNLKPTILFSYKTGLIAAWISVIDIIGGKGIIDKWNTIRVAVRKNNQWQQVATEEGLDIADLRHSMLSSIEPPGPIWGYSGQRRYPILIEDDGDVWLLWERKIEHEGSAGSPGELCGRKFNGVTWTENLQLLTGMINYHVPTSKNTAGNKLTVTALNTQQQYYSFNISLVTNQKLNNIELTGWKPIQLPIQNNISRDSISIDNEIYYLYWGDLHFHTGLTPDAEGEVDEMIYFARDKAKIDVLVMSENDAASWLNISNQGVYYGENLAESAFQLSIYFSKKYSENGRFISLPGWEWSDRTDDGYPNHRTVIFSGDDTPILRHTENLGNFSELCDAVDAAGGVMNTQHETFQLIDHPVEGNIEVVSAWGNFLEPPDKIHAYLSKGFKVGFVGNSDGHRQNAGIGGGLTGIYATKLTAESILEAIKNHRVYATNGNRMFIDARANDIIMGQDVKSNGPVKLNIHIKTHKPLIQATLIRNGERIYTVSGEGQKILNKSYIDNPSKGFYWYYWEIQQEGEWPDYPGNVKVAEGNLGWSSPHRVIIQ